MATSLSTSASIAKTPFRYFLEGVAPSQWRFGEVRSAVLKGLGVGFAWVALHKWVGYHSDGLGIGVGGVGGDGPEATEDPKFFRYYPYLYVLFQPIKRAALCVEAPNVARQLYWQMIAAADALTGVHHEYSTHPEHCPRTQEEWEARDGPLVYARYRELVELMKRLLASLEPGSERAHLQLIQAEWDDRWRMLYSSIFHLVTVARLS